MILVDTSVWVDHLRSRDASLAVLLEGGMVVTHPFVIGEIALGDLRQREVILEALSDLPQAVVATDGEVIEFIGRHRLFGQGIGFVDAHLLVATKLSDATTLWSRDRRLQAVATSLGLAMAGDPAPPG